MIQAEQLHARILEELDLSRDIPDEELTELIHRVLDEASGREYIPLGKKAELGRELFNAFRKFDLLQEFLEDDERWCYGWCILPVQYRSDRRLRFCRKDGSGIRNPVRPAGKCIQQPDRRIGCYCRRSGRCNRFRHRRYRPGNAGCY